MKCNKIEKPIFIIIILILFIINGINQSSIINSMNQQRNINEKKEEF
ncbi:MAG: hypothetical protein GF308_07550 [Candidatus Heimdallarchaeota archaeon]|nr:hypothetical protein [Candidatus Heimdallarchaeota archaeon]